MFNCRLSKSLSFTVKDFFFFLEFTPTFSLILFTIVIIKQYCSEPICAIHVVVTTMAMIVMTHRPCKHESKHSAKPVDGGDPSRTKMKWRGEHVPVEMHTQTHLPCVSVDWVNQPNFPFFFSVRSASVTPWCNQHAVHKADSRGSSESVHRGTNWWHAAVSSMTEC